MKDLKTFAVLVFVVHLTQPVIFAQEARDSIIAHNWFDSQIGVGNTHLYNGIEYIEQHVTVNEKQKFLGSTLFTPGWVVYEGQPYYDVPLKYNVYDDLLLLKSSGEKPLQLHKNLIESFNLSGLTFTNVPSESGGVEGFHEVLVEQEGGKLLKKHTKKRKKFLDRSFTYYEFSEDTPQYAIYYNSAYHPANNLRQVVKAFPDHAREVRAFYREQRSLARSNPDQFMVNLFREFIRHNS